MVLEYFRVGECLLDHVEPEHHPVVGLAGVHYDLQHFPNHLVVDQRLEVAVAVPEQVRNGRHRVRNKVGIVDGQRLVELGNQQSEILREPELMLSYLSV